MKWQRLRWSRFLISILVSHTALAASIPPIIVDNKQVVFPDAKPYYEENGVLMVPLRFIFEAAGADVTWKNGIVTATRRDKKVRIKIGDKTAYVNGEPRVLPSAPEIKEKRTFLPLETVFKMLGAYVVCDTKCAVFIDKVRTVVYGKGTSVITRFDIPQSLMLVKYDYVKISDPFKANSKLLIVVEKGEGGCIGVRGNEVYYTRDKYALKDMNFVCGKIGVWKDGMLYGGDSSTSEGFVVLVV